jgi:hypothetical protein
MIKKKKLLVIFVLLIAFFITGCTVPSTYTGSDEAKIESVIKQFFSALEYQNWSKAKSCCVYGSDAYEAICEFENDVNYLETICGYVKINTYVNVANISISGNYAYVICDASLSISACGVTENNSEYGYLELSKIGNSWKLL